MFVAGAAVLPESSPRELVARDVHKAGGRDALGGGEGETIKRWALKEDRPSGDRRGIETNDLGMPEMAAYPKTEAENSVISVIGSENSTKTDTKKITNITYRNGAVEDQNPSRHSGRLAIEDFRLGAART